MTILSPVESVTMPKPKKQSTPMVGYGKKDVILTPAKQTPPRKA